MGNDVVILNLDREALTEIVQSAVREALENYNKSTPPMQQPEDLLSAEDAAVFLNLKISSLYFKTHMKEIPFMKKGKKIYFSRKELTQWVAEGRQYTRTESAKMADMKLGQLKRR